MKEFYAEIDDHIKEYEHGTNMTDGLLSRSLRLRCLRSGAAIYKISGTRSVISLGLFIAAGYALSIFIRRNEVTLCRRAKTASGSDGKVFYVVVAALFASAALTTALLVLHRLA
jgi:hypothetical protein